MAIDHHHTITVAIKSDTQVSLGGEHTLNQGLRMGRAHAIVDVNAIRSRTDAGNVSAELTEYERSHVVSCAMSAIEHHRKAFQTHMGIEGRLAELDVATRGIVLTESTAKERWLDTGDLMLKGLFDR